MTKQDFPDLSQHQGWIVNLNNGETVFETAPIPGEKTPWRKLQMRLKEETFMKAVYEIIEDRKTKVGEEETKLAVTSLRLQRGGLNIHTMSKKRCDGYYHAYEYRKSMLNPDRPGVQSQGIGTVIGDEVYIIWINPYGQIYQDVRPLEGSRIFTTLS